MPDTAEGLCAARVPAAVPRCTSPSPLRRWLVGTAHRRAQLTGGHGSPLTAPRCLSSTARGAADAPAARACWLVPISCRGLPGPPCRDNGGRREPACPTRGTPARWWVRTWAGAHTNSLYWKHVQSSNALTVPPPPCRVLELGAAPASPGSVSPCLGLRPEPTPPSLPRLLSRLVEELSDVQHGLPDVPPKALRVLWGSTRDPSDSPAPPRVGHGPPCPWGTPCALGPPAGPARAAPRASSGVGGGGVPQEGAGMQQGEGPKGEGLGCSRVRGCPRPMGTPQETLQHGWQLQHQERHRCLPCLGSPQPLHPLLRGHPSPSPSAPRLSPSHCWRTCWRCER